LSRLSAAASICFDRELDSNEIDERELQQEKHDNARLSKVCIISK
jgi:hypothetical protein